jgi:hypothetical protein
MERMPNPDDRRSYLVGLSDAGMAAHAAAASSFRTVARRMSDALGEDETAQRAALQRLDHALRGITAVDSRPYQVAGSPPGTPLTLTFQGPALTPAQEHQVRRYIEFIRSSD